MSRSTPWLLAALTVPLMAIAGHPSVAKAQAVVYPPSAYVATYEPIYFQGRAHYFYRAHWYYRDHGAWRGYDHEPAFLLERRAEWARHRRGWWVR